jgi:hypothetical protein
MVARLSGWAANADKMHGWLNSRNGVARFRDGLLIARYVAMREMGGCEKEMSG